MRAKLFTNETCWKTATADRFAWLIDGENYFRALRESMQEAEREILIIGWDIDSEVELVRDENHPHYPSPLAATLESLVDAKNDLQVRVLSWDFAFVYMLERELLPAYRFGWSDSARLHFSLDGKHVTGASHHQKFVVIDGVLAFIGGFDLTKCRWDSREHAPNDARRIDTRGNSYRPFHDVQAIVSGEVAGQLRQLGAMRWHNATGQQLPDLATAGTHGSEDCWPASVTPMAVNAQAALSRTWAEPDEENVIREVEQLFLEMIGNAQSSIYIENQYFTSPAIAAALGDRLEERDGPEIVIILPDITSGWLEQVTMEMRRNQLLAGLRERDTFDRLRVCAPVSDDLPDSNINVHGKVMVVDDRWCRIGSANLSCRSMGLDSECDLTIADDAQDAAPRLRADLLAEHLGADPDDVAQSIAERGLVATLDTFNHGSRRVRMLDPDSSEYTTVLEPLAQVADMEQPIENLWVRRDASQPERTVSKPLRKVFRLVTSPAAGWTFLVSLLVAVALWAGWAAQNLDGDIDLFSILAALRERTDHPLAPLLAVPAIVAGSLVVAPITVMIGLCALLFSPWVASATALTGTLAATAVNHQIGKRLGNVVEEKAPKALSSRMQDFAASADAWSLAGLRLIPIAPFTVVNLLAGAARVALAPFLLGTLIGMGPGIVFICLSVDRARAALSGEPVFDPLIIGAIIALGIALIGFRVWRQRRGNSE